VFSSFFPRPKLFFPSVLLWTFVCVVGWYLGGADLGAAVGLPPAAPGTPPVIGLAYFVTPDFLWFYLYGIVSVVLFASFWFVFSPHPWQWWSIVGSALIIFIDYYGVQAQVAVNNWRGPMFDAIQNALDGKGNVTVHDLFSLIWTFLEIALVAVAVFSFNRFFVSHWVFRWRNAMNDYYMARWTEIRLIEGASQRVQEDTMRFATIMEDLGISAVDSLLTLVAFLPILAALSKNVTELPIIGVIPDPLVVAAIFWSVFGTLLLSVAGLRLPGLTFLNQRVEAAYRKELVYGEDDPTRAGPPTTQALFANVRRNYFRLYFHYVYFNATRSLYLQIDNVFAMVILVPTIVAGKITFGIYQQIQGAFSQVSGSFQYLVYAWSTVIELMSIHKRLRAFEAQFTGKQQAGIEDPKNVA
jgi:peptide/bleomycin uptake transporter